MVTHSKKTEATAEKAWQLASLLSLVKEYGSSKDKDDMAKISRYTRSIKKEGCESSS